MRKFVVLNKRVGETPLVALQKWKERNPAYASIRASYAGRLDPMASGVLLVLLGEECKRQSAYTNLDKEYEIEVLFDVGSDTGDILGIPTIGTATLLNEDLMSAALLAERGAHTRPYPAFSSKTVGGKPLFLHALEGTLGKIEIPEHIEHIYSISNLGSYTLSRAELEERIFALLDLVPRTNEPSKKLGEDFRVDTIRTHWESLFTRVGAKNFRIIRLKVICASGTYMRTLAGRIGKSLGTEALALSIKRTKIGTYIPILTTGFWLRTFR